MGGFPGFGCVLVFGDLVCLLATYAAGLGLGVLGFGFVCCCWFGGFCLSDVVGLVMDYSWGRLLVVVLCFGLDYGC